MKYDNLIYGLGAFVVVVCAIIKILHMPGAEIADIVYKMTFLVMFLFMTMQNTKLKKKVKELQGH